MKTKQVTRYQCDFCGKKGYAASPMAKHEKHCTMNPARECRVCKMLKHKQPKLAKLTELLPDGKAFVYEHNDEDGILIGKWPDFNKLKDAVSPLLPELRERAGNCPACIMAALRQRNIPVPSVTDFNFTDEMKAIWDDINDAKMAHDEQYV